MAIVSSGRNQLGTKKSTRNSKRSVKKSKSKHSKKTSDPSLRKVTKKYTSRNSPPYPANQLCGKIMTGNDGKLYVSKPNKKKICSWRKK